jgi:predicted nucleic acid-binding protein
MTFVDTGILVGALLEKQPEHRQCLAALELYTDCVAGAHALAEVFATLTGFYETVIREARSRGVMGVRIYDALHSTFARNKRANRIITRNASHFAHTAPELEILTPLQVTVTTLQLAAIPIGPHSHARCWAATQSGR